MFCKEAVASFKRVLKPEAEAIERQLRTKTGITKQFVIDCISRRGLARQRALRLAESKLTGAVIRGERDLLDIRYLMAHQHLIANPIHPGEKQDNITVHTLAA